MELIWPAGLDGWDEEEGNAEERERKEMRYTVAMRLDKP